MVELNRRLGKTQNNAEFLMSVKVTD